jgi:predicted HTH transcriptional regulator
VIGLDTNVLARYFVPEAERLQLSHRAVEKHLAALQQKGRLRRQGSPQAGHWQVL